MILAEPTRDLADVALACGHCDQSSFTRALRATVGLTPGQYRTRFRRGARHRHRRPSPK